jgi:predicted lipid-binding transport protein (Tim44 family)
MTTKYIQLLFCLALVSCTPYSQLTPAQKAQRDQAMYGIAAGLAAGAAAAQQPRCIEAVYPDSDIETLQRDVRNVQTQLDDLQNNHQ